MELIMTSFLTSGANNTLQLGAWGFVQKQILQIPTITLSVAVFD
jgi:hypothetical protein